MTDNELDDWKHLNCFHEVDLEHPEDLHSLHDDYPLAPERIRIKNVEKRISDLNNKTNYVVHYENLKSYESLCLKITKIHRGIKSKKVLGWKNISGGPNCDCCTIFDENGHCRSHEEDKASL